MATQLQSSSTAAPDAHPNGFTLPALPQESRLCRERGWLLPTLFQTDAKLYGRWNYLTDCWEQGVLPPSPIPPLPFLSTPDKATWKMLTVCLDAIPERGQGGWTGWSSTTYLTYFLEWMLHGLAHTGQPEPPNEPTGCQGASDRLHAALDLPLWQQNPYDYLGDLLSQNAYGKRQGFFPTPHTVCEMMTRMSFADGADSRRLTVCDPCVGTGRLLLHASNHSLRLYGMDIDPMICLATLVNGYLFAPWLVRPLPYLDGAQYDPEESATISEEMAAQAPPHVAATLTGSQHDAEEQWRFEPIKKRRLIPAEDTEVWQGVLF